MVPFDKKDGLYENYINYLSLRLIHMKGSCVLDRMFFPLYSAPARTLDCLKEEIGGLEAIKY